MALEISNIQDCICCDISCPALNHESVAFAEPATTRSPFTRRWELEVILDRAGPNQVAGLTNAQAGVYFEWAASLSIVEVYSYSKNTGNIGSTDITMNYSITWSRDVTDTFWEITASGTMSRDREEANGDTYSYTGNIIVDGTDVYYTGTATYTESGGGVTNVTETYPASINSVFPTDTTTINSFTTSGASFTATATGESFTQTWVNRYPRKYRTYISSDIANQGFLEGELREVLVNVADSMDTPSRTLASYTRSSYTYDGVSRSNSAYVEPTLYSGYYINQDIESLRRCTPYSPYL